MLTVIVIQIATKTISIEFSHAVLNRVIFRATKSGGYLLRSIVPSAIVIAMLVVGAQHQEACKNGGAQYLIVQGSFFWSFSFWVASEGTWATHHSLRYWVVSEVLHP